MINYYCQDLEQLKEKITSSNYTFDKPKEYKIPRGIITASGTVDRLRDSYVSIKMLRDTGCKLPIELFYADEQEMPKSLYGIFHELNVNCINVQSHYPFAEYNARNFSIKAIALYLSKFREIIWMDSDVIPLVNFEALFNNTQYINNGYLFNNDLWSFKKLETVFTDKIEKFMQFLKDDDKFSILPGSPELDSGLFLLNQEKLPYKFFDILLLLNTNNHLIYDKVCYGDKDTFQIAIRMLFDNFYYNLAHPAVIGVKADGFLCGNGIILKHDYNNIAVHMTLRSISELKKMDIFQNDNPWTHYIGEPIRFHSPRVEILHQIATPYYEYENIYMKEIDSEINNAQINMYKYFEYIKNIIN